MLDNDSSLPQECQEGNAIAIILDSQLPIDVQIPGGMQGTYVLLDGLVNASPGRVSLSLMTDDKNIPFHFDIRFSYGTDRNLIVLNTMTNNGWATEVRPAGFPFAPNQRFSLLINCEAGVIFVRVSGAKIYTYDRLKSCDSMNRLHISGSLAKAYYRIHSPPK
jgi:hypothetical protein